MRLKVAFLFLFLSPGYLMSTQFIWGETVKVGVSKEFVDNLLKNYVETTYSKKVKNYRDNLLKIRREKLKAYDDVIFLSSGYMWQDSIENKTLKLNALEATRYCRNLTHATKKDWKLPSYHELLQLVNYFRYDPAVHDEINYIVPKKYWTSSSVLGDYSATWIVDFKYGETGVHLRTDKLNVRCVRELNPNGDDF